MTALLEAARHYRKLGWRMVPVPHKSKAPKIRGWPTFEAGPDLGEHFTDGNLGVILGPLSGNLVDVDLDSPEAVDLAPTFLPGTWTFGRKSKPKSHWLYLVPGGALPRVFRDLPNTDGKRTTLLELRAGGAKVLQTVFPPSTHVSGERIEWSEDADGSEAPREMSAADLAEHLEGLAVAVLLRRHLARDLVDAWLEDSCFPNAPPALLEHVQSFLGCNIPRKAAPVARSTHASADFLDAVARYNRDHERELPRQGGECPVCRHRGCFGQLKAESRRWVCFSTAHSGAGLEGEGCWTGDLLDLDAYAEGVARTEFLQRRGYFGGAR
ncbi:MAG: hypothetical protein RL653_4238 [Pseudomonadota bacterium]|jgi:hypothetical protein